MPKISRECKNALNSVSLHRLFPGLQGSGMTLNGKCPLCGAEGKKKSKWQGLWVKDDPVRNSQMAGCNSCKEKAGGGAVNVVMKFFRLGFVQACEMIAKESGIEITYEEQDRFRTPDAKPEASSFCARQLADSGLSVDDIRVKARDGEEQYLISPFQKGSLNTSTGEIDLAGDEMLILYFDLEGRRRTCTPAKFKSREVPYTRVRWSFPENHGGKYHTIAGAYSTVYIPQKVRDCYKNKTHIDTLFIQEGEKKAEKSCKHGILSVAIQGINSIGRQDEGLPTDIQYLVQRCSIDNIVLLFDSDWFNLASSLSDDDSIDKRPLAFARAVIKFRKFVKTLSLCNLNVDIWFAHVNSNDAGDKGIDDLLCNTLKGREDSLKVDIDKAMTAHDGKGEFVDAFNITSWTDSRIMKLWCLDSAEDFFNSHIDALREIKSFRFGGIFYRNDDGNFSLSSEYSDCSQFWGKTKDDKGKLKDDINLVRLLDFLSSNGFRRHKVNGKSSFVRIVDGIIQEWDEFSIRDFVRAFVNRSTKDEKVIRFITENIVSVMSVPNLCLLEKLDVVTKVRLPECQKFFFKNCEAVVYADRIESAKLIGPVWEKDILSHDFNRVRIFSVFQKNDDGSFSIIPTEDGKRCEFFRFICNTSRNSKIPDSNGFSSDTITNIANKVTAIGYLMRSYRNLTERVAVVAMDAKMSQVGFSSGRTGKSFIGEALSKMIKKAFIGGRKLKNDDEFMFNPVNRDSDFIFVDDIKESFPIKSLFDSITGALVVNKKQGERFNLEFEEAPRFYITTNHAFPDLDDSAKARVAFLSFSDWYSLSYSPANEFGHRFFEGWDEDQWCLFYNFMLECLMIYTRSAELGWAGVGCGVIQPPMESIYLRSLRQTMGETFLSWAELYFSKDSGHLNYRIVRKEMYMNFLSDYDIKSSQLTAKSFKDKVIAYCRYAGYNFNAHRPNEKGQNLEEWVYNNPEESFIGGRDISGPMEYFTVSTKDFCYEK